jgi:hypothetical protein
LLSGRRHPRPEWKLEKEQLLEFGDQIQVQPMHTERLEFMATHQVAGGGPGPRRGARD